MTTHTFRKKWGQNFLQDPNIIRKIIAQLDPQPHDVVIEIGPGLGILTDALLKAEAQVTAIEIDKEISGNYIENKEDTEIQEEFWKIYFQYINKNEISKTLPRISPSFLRSNLDLLN